MAAILAVGIATLDLIHEIDAFPAEDSERRALTQQVVRGGNATNTLVVLSQLGHQTYWAGSLADDHASEVIQRDLQNYHVDMQACHHVTNAVTPLSMILLNRKTASRTISHYRDLPEYPLTAFKALSLQHYDWLHFEGRDVPAVAAMMQHVRATQKDIRISVELEKPRDAIEALLPHADVVMCSRDYAQSQGYTSAAEALNALHTRNPHALISCTWGDKGAAAIDAQANLFQCEAQRIAQPLDTRAAGDVFNAGFIDALCQGKSVQQSLAAAVALAGRKCAQMGLENLA